MLPHSQPCHQVIRSGWSGLHWPDSVGRSIGSSSRERFPAWHPDRATARTCWPNRLAEPPAGLPDLPSLGAAVKVLSDWCTLFLETLQGCRIRQPYTVETGRQRQPYPWVSGQAGRPRQPYRASQSEASPKRQPYGHEPTRNDSLKPACPDKTVAESEPTAILDGAGPGRRAGLAYWAVPSCQPAAPIQPNPELPARRSRLKRQPRPSRTRCVAGAKPGASR